MKRLLSGGWMGREPIDHDEIGGVRVSRQNPPEDIREGCPGGWYRSRFVASLHPFLRTRTEHGMRVPNPFFDRCTDDLVLQLVLYLEEQQEAFEAWAFGQVIDG